MFWCNKRSRDCTNSQEIPPFGVWDLSHKYIERSQRLEEEPHKNVNELIKIKLHNNEALGCQMM